MEGRVSAGDLDRLLTPRSVAIVGASSDPAKSGARLVANLRAGSHPLHAFCVNPRYPEIGGFPCFDRLAKLPLVPDVAVIAVAPQEAIQTVREAVSMGVPYLMLVTGGFNEIGELGVGRQAEIDRELAGTSTRLVGPNCSGIWNVHDGVYLTISQDLVHAHRVAGPIALVSQSGGLGRCFMDRGLDVSYWFGTGNNADLTEADYVRHLCTLDDVTTIVLVVEGLNDLVRLGAALGDAWAAGKRVVAMKVGRSELGQRAAQSHTGAMTTDSRLVDALFRQHNVIQVEDIDEAANVASLITSRATSPREDSALGICAFSGGSATLVADAAGTAGLVLAELDPATQERLRAFLPPFASTKNPVDLTTHVYQDYSIVSRSLETLASDPQVGTILFPFTSRTGDPDVRIAEQIVAFVESTGWRQIVAIDVSADRAPAPWAHVLEEARIPWIRGTQRAVDALKKARAATFDLSVEFSPLDQDLPDVPRGAITEAVAKRWLRELGLPIPDQRQLSTPSEVVSAAEDIGYPVVLKLDVAGIAHKTEQGFVVTHITDNVALEAALRRMEEARALLTPGTESAYLLERHVADGVDFIVGMERDDAFGYFLMLGSGGVLTELIGDSVCCLLPATQQQLWALPDMVRSGRLLSGVRGSPMADRNALVEALHTIGSIPAALPPGSSMRIEINPLRVLADKQGVVLLDANIRIDAAEPVHQRAQRPRRPSRRSPG
jgi:acyl-CoA synthetase (NDP forming)